MSDMISQQQLEQFREVGFFLTDVVFEATELKALADEMDRVYEEHLQEVIRNGGTDAEIKAAKGRRAFGAFHKLSDMAAEFVKATIYLEASRKLIGNDVDLYYNQAAVKPPGIGRTFNWHQDSGYTTTVPLEYITCWTAVDDSDLGNGCIWVIPGSHKHGVLPHVRNDENDERYSGLTAQIASEEGAIPVEMKAGQVAIFSSLMLHKSGPNTSNDRFRRGYVPQYHVPGVYLEKTGQHVGDQFPVLRNGKRVAIGDA